MYCDAPDEAVPAGISAAQPRPTVSALASTYARERASWLDQSLDSIFSQSRPPDQMILVIDGPIGPDLEAVVERYESDARIERFSVLRLTTNQGLAEALNAGLTLCDGDWIMRMDSDDVCRADRVEVQLRYLSNNPNIDIVTSWIEEFSDDDPAIRLKASPIEHSAIMSALRWRNILAHPSVLVRTKTLRQIGGYRANFDKLEDYDLYVRLVLAGARFHVLPVVLVRMRAGPQQSDRRGGWRYCLHDLRFRTFCLRSGFMNCREYVMVTMIYVIFRLIASPMRRRLYRFARLELR
jgi:GT2 family glycosyltransferase